MKRFELKCKTCGLMLSSKDISIVNDGYMISVDVVCPKCDSEDILAERRVKNNVM